MDTVLLVRRRTEYRTLTSVQRSGEDLPETVIALDAAHRPTAEGTREEHELREVEDAILVFLGERTGPMPEPEIREGVEARTKALNAALRTLVQDGRVARMGAGKRGDPYRYLVSCSLVPDI